MTTLGQIVGIHKGTKEEAQRRWDTIYHTLQKNDLFTGLHKTFEAFEGTLPQPPQDKRLQANATDLLREMQPLLTRLFDLEYTKDVADTQATANVYLPGISRPLLENVPISHLLWLEKQFIKLVTVFKALPVMSAAEDWTGDATSLPTGVRRTPVEETPATKKEKQWQVVVAADANGGHPADVREVTSDVHSGNWRTIKYTSAVPVAVRDELVKRATAMLNAVRQAAVAANHLVVQDQSEGEIIFGFLYGDLL